jgi:hypothetical protein
MRDQKFRYGRVVKDEIALRYSVVRPKDLLKVRQVKRAVLRVKVTLLRRLGYIDKERRMQKSSLVDLEHGPDAFLGFVVKDAVKIGCLA